MTQQMTEVTPRYYDVHNPHNKWGVGQVEVVGHKISRTTRAYRWAVGMEFEQFISERERLGFMLPRRFTPAKSLGTKREPLRFHKPTDLDLYCRVSP